MSNPIEIVKTNRGYVLRRDNGYITSYLRGFNYFNGDFEGPYWWSEDYKHHAKLYWTLRGAKSAIKRINHVDKVVYREGDDDLV